MGTADARGGLSAPIGSVAMVAGGNGSNFPQVLRPNLRRAFHPRSWTASARRSLSERRIILEALGFIPPSSPRPGFKLPKGQKVQVASRLLRNGADCVLPTGTTRIGRTRRTPFWCSPGLSDFFPFLAY